MPSYLNNYCRFVLATALSQAASVNAAEGIREITVKAYPPLSQISAVKPAQQPPQPDSANLLSRVPGGSANNNGTLTGIAQYRGLFGDRVAVSINGAPVLSGGPNAMDTPLSYAPAAMVKELWVHRGIAPVSAAQESIGGHMAAVFDRGQFSASADGHIRGFASSHYADNGQQFGAHGQLIIANNRHKLSLLTSHDEGDNVQAGDQRLISGSQYLRDRTDLSYAWQSPSASAELTLGQLDIRDTGTAALAMDITSVKTDLASLELNLSSRDIAWSVHLAWADILHSMDNHSLRTAPMMNMGYRKNLASADNQSWTIKAKLPLGDTQLTLGTDGNLADHQSIISNPLNPQFQLVNFHNIERDTLGIFAELSGSAAAGWNYELGLRFNQVSLNADRVSAAGMMAMMANYANNLASQFNDGARDIRYSNTDRVVKLSKALTPTTSVHIDLGIKKRAPSYQELFVWLPLPITGGLADGRNYLGNPGLDSESAREINLGLNYNSASLSLTPQIFYRRVDNYIQGTPSTDETANRISTMMSGTLPLVQSNIDAEIYGLDTDWHHAINHSWAVDAVLSYVRGKRADGTDNLYRIAPLNGRIQLHYIPSHFEAKLRLSLEAEIYGRQTKVARFNNESPSAGYGLINLMGRWTVNKRLHIQAGISNLFNRSAANHLSGRNRIGGSQLPLGEQLLEPGRSLSLAARLSW